MTFPAPQANDINILCSFLANAEISSLSDKSIPKPIDCIALCGSAILHCAETVFSALRPSSSPSLAKTLVICGGIGHSTPLLYDAVKAHPRYAALFSDSSMDGLPEARVLETIGKHIYGLAEREDLRVIVEDRSTNCGANATETRRVLDEASLRPQTVVIVQDATMSRRTKAGFLKMWADRTEVRFWTWPTFVPRVVAEPDGVLRYDVQGVDPAGFWRMERLYDLLLGEILRMRDDENGYGPRGKGFIVHIDIPKEVEKAWGNLKRVFNSTRAAS